MLQRMGCSGEELGGFEVTMMNDDEKQRDAMAGVTMAGVTMDNATMDNVTMHSVTRSSITRSSEGKAQRRHSPSIALLLITFVSTVASGCHYADLRPEAFPPLAEGRALALKEEARTRLKPYDNYGALLWQLEDRWNSSLLRWFTPLDEDRQRLHVSLALNSSHPDRVTIVRVGSADRHFERDPDAQSAAKSAVAAPTPAPTPSQPTSSRDGRVREQLHGYLKELSGLDALYVESVVRYLQLPLRWPLAAATRWQRCLDDITLDGVHYHRIYAAPSDSEAGGDEDQVILWLAHSTLELRYAQFTYRSVTPGYQGTLEYSDYRTPHGAGRAAPLPHRVRVLNAPGDRESIHDFVVARIDAEAIAPENPVAVAKERTRIAAGMEFHEPSACRSTRCQYTARRR